MKLILENKYGTHTVEKDCDDGQIGDYINAFRGLLLSAGFTEKSVENVLGGWNE